MSDKYEIIDLTKVFDKNWVEQNKCESALETAANLMPNKASKDAFLYIFQSEDKLTGKEPINWNTEKRNAFEYLRISKYSPDVANDAIITVLTNGVQAYNAAKLISNPTHVSYEGFFLDDKEKEGLLVFINAITEMSGKDRLEKIAPDMHVTVNAGKLAENFDINAIGEDVDITIKGYANDGKNEGILIDLHSKNPKLQQKFDKLEKPFIAISVATGERAVNTKNLDFETLPDFLKGDFHINAKYGVYTDHGVITSKRLAQVSFPEKAKQTKKQVEHNWDVR